MACQYFRRKTDQKRLKFEVLVSQMSHFFVVILSLSHSGQQNFIFRFICVVFIVGRVFVRFWRAAVVVEGGSGSRGWKWEYVGRDFSRDARRMRNSVRVLNLLRRTTPKF